MEEEDNRNCSCDMNNEQKQTCYYNPQGINAAFGYNTMKNLNDDLLSYNDNNTCMNNRNEIREKMLKEIKCLKFAIVELTQYLDTHPDDKKALCLHNEYANRLRRVQDKYERIFGPLSIYCPCNKWRWIEMPWPWERSDLNVDL